MKKRLRFVAVACCCMLVPALAGCTGKGTLLRGAAAAAPLSFSERNDAFFTAVAEGAQHFSTQFAAAMYKEHAPKENFAVSPVSVYTGLSLAAACAAGETRAQLLDALGVTETELTEGFTPFYRSLTADGKDNAGKQRTMLHIANAIYVGEGTQVRDECLDTLATDYFCNTYAADFAGDNSGANRAVRNFVKEQTNGLIDRNFALPEETLFALVNALYLKDTWNTYGSDLPEARDGPFACAGGSSKTVSFLRGYYTQGRAHEGAVYISYHADTFAGYKIKFLLPKDGCTLNDVMNAEVLAELAAVTDYRALDTENRVRYHTRCLFPAFSAGCDEDAKDVLRKTFGVTELFAETCDLSALTDEAAFVTGIRHAATVTVDKKGIEGAAATVLSGGTDPGPDEYEDVYCDFVVDRAFGFLVTDRYDAVLFAGAVLNV